MPAQPPDGRYGRPQPRAPVRWMQPGMDGSQLLTQLPAARFAQALIKLLLSSNFGLQCRVQVELELPSGGFGCCGPAMQMAFQQAKVFQFRAHGSDRKKLGSQPLHGVP